MCVCVIMCVYVHVWLCLSPSLSHCVCVCVCFYVYIRMCVCGYVSLSLTLCGYVCVLPDGCSQDDGNTHSHRQSVFTRRSSFLRVQSKPDKRDTSVIKPQDHTSPPVQNLLQAFKGALKGGRESCSWREVQSQLDRQCHCASQCFTVQLRCVNNLPSHTGTS